MHVKFYLQRKQATWIEMRIKNGQNEDGHFKLECLQLIMLI